MSARTLNAHHFAMGLAAFERQAQACHTIELLPDEGGHARETFEFIEFLLRMISGLDPVKAANFIR